MTKTQKKRLKTAAVLSCAALALTGGTVFALQSSSYAESGVSFSAITLEDEYVMNTMVEVPRVTMSLGGNDYPTTAVLHGPDGSARLVNGETKLDMFGNYTFEYKAAVSGKTYSVEKKVYVYKPKFLLSDEGDIAEYRTNSVAGLDGEYISLSQDGKLTVNDYFDITKATTAAPIFEASIIPAAEGVQDFETLTVRFISKNDPSEYLTVVCNYYSYNNCTYFQAGANTQTPAGYESMQGTIHVGNTWGAPYSGSFRGVPNPGLTLAQDTLKIYLDYESKVVYANFAKGFVIDLNDAKYFGTLWDGFADGEVYTEVTASRFTGQNAAQMLIVRNGDIDLTEQYIYDTAPPTIDIDLEGYTPSDVPDGVKGMEYGIFKASAVDHLSGECAVDVHVYGRYFGSQKYEEQITDGKFVPENSGAYVIEYSATDRSGNTAVERVFVNVADNASPIAIALANKVQNGKAGELIDIAEITANGGSGTLDIDTKVTFDGNEVSVTDGKFRPMAAGTYTVAVTAIDHIGQTRTESYSVTVAANESPVFIDPVVLPKYLIAGSEYAMPEVYAYDLSGEYKKVRATLVTDDGGGVKEHTDGKYTPNVSTHGETVKVWYKATVNGTTAESEKHSIITCAPGTGSSIDIQKYFVPSGTAVETTNDGAIVTASTDGASVDFANPLLANNLTMSFNVNPDKSSFTALNVILSDSANSQEAIKITYEKSSDTSSFMSVNGGTAFSIPASFTGGSAYAFELKFDNRNSIASYGNDVKFDVKQTMYGAAFNGFSSGKVYVTFEFAGVRGESSITLSELGGQRMTDVAVDLIKPKIDLFDELAFRYELGDTVSLAPAIAADVLDPNIKSSYTVSDPDGTVAHDVNGKELKDIPINETYDIKLTEYGIYRVNFTAVDWNGRAENNFSYALEVVDGVAPIIVLNGEVPTSANVGDKMDLPLAMATDAIDGSRQVYAYVLRPDGRYVAYGEGMTFELKGKYTVVYYSFDESGNTAKLTFGVDVK